MNPKRITPATIAESLEMTEPQLWRFVRKIENGFKPPRELKENSKTRTIEPPKKVTKYLLRKLHRFLQSQKFFHPSAHGCINKRSCFTSARKHLGRMYVWTRDAKDCYPSVTPDALAEELKKLGFRFDTAQILTRLFTIRGHIPQGSPVSGDALNIFFWNTDQKLSAYAGANHLKYSRVADDFIVSGKAKKKGDKAMRMIEDEFTSRGIKTNDKKRRKSGFQTPSQKKLVHNIRVDNRKGTSICDVHKNSFRKKADSYLHACRRVQPSSLEAVAVKRKSLEGCLNYVRQAEFGPLKYLKQMLRQGDILVSKKLKSMKLSAKKNKWWLINRKHNRNEPRKLAKIWLSRLAT